jgi:hypothetical protein
VANLRQRPRIREIKMASAEKLDSFYRSLKRAFSACLRDDLHPGALPQANMN